ncbi:MAG: hypothetical protein ABL877_07245 [Thiobacillus sp.]
MMPDQATGLRRQAVRATAAAVVCAGTPADTAKRLSRTLCGQGLATLIVNTNRQPHAIDQPRNLFDWRVQLQRGELHPLPTDSGHVLAAPGALAGEPELVRAARAFDCVVFDAGRLDAALSVAADHATLWLVGLSHASTLAAFALCKTLSRAGVVAQLLVWGAWRDYENLRAACEHFLPGVPVQIEFAASEDAAIAMLAARMTARSSRHQVRLQDNPLSTLHGEQAGTPANHG